MADNRKMIATGVVLVGVLLVMTACARSETSFKFHPALGICDAEEELYEAKNPMQELDTEYGSATMEYVVWKDGFLHVKIVADYSSDADDWEQADQFLSVQDEEKSKLTSLSRYCNYDEKQKQLTIEQEYRSITPQGQYVLKLFDQTATIHMTSVPEYNSLKEIGTPVTHNGRTWVFQGTWEDDETLKLHAWGTSDDIWQMGRPMKEPVTPEDVKKDGFIQWKQSGIEGSSSFEATVKASEDIGYELKIPGISLVADMGEDGPIVEIPVPAVDGTEDVDVSFFAGKDTYHIGKVERRKKESQDDDGKNKVSTEVILYVEPENLEKDTELLSINASWGELKSQGDPTTFSLKGSTFPPAMYVDGELAELRQELTLTYSEAETVPEIVAVRIDKVGKVWNQEYHCKIK